MQYLLVSLLLDEKYRTQRKIYERNKLEPYFAGNWENEQLDETYAGRRRWMGWRGNEKKKRKKKRSGDGKKVRNNGRNNRRTGRLIFELKRSVTRLGKFGVIYRNISFLQFWSILFYIIFFFSSFRLLWSF